MAMSPLVRARDGGYSGSVWGHSVWVFGDTVLAAPDEDGLTWHHNSFSIHRSKIGRKIKIRARYYLFLLRAKR